MGISFVTVEHIAESLTGTLGISRDSDTVGEGNFISQIQVWKHRTSVFHTKQDSVMSYPYLASGNLSSVASSLFLLLRLVSKL